MEDTIRKIKDTLARDFSQGEIKSIIKIIFEKLKGYSQVDIIMHDKEILSEHIKSEIDKVLARLLKHEPIQYIFNEACFHGLTLRVSPHTLIPRPETSELVDIIVKENTAPDLHVLDIGTGSGAIAIALARNLKFPCVDAVDISSEALAIAEENAKRLKTKINFGICDILTAVPPEEAAFDIIVSNPPYITDSERETMETNVLGYEPHTALFVPDDDPLLFYRAITNYAVHALRPHGRIYFEINSRFGKETAELLSDTGFDNATVIKDMYGLDRFVSAFKNEDYER